MSAERTQLHVSRTDGMIDELLQLKEDDHLVPFTELEHRIMDLATLLFHNQKGLSREMGKAAEQARQASTMKGVEARRDKLALMLTGAVMALHTTSALGSMAPGKTHSFAGRWIDLSHYDMSTAQDVQAFTKIFSKTLSSVANSVEAPKQLWSERLQSHIAADQSDADSARSRHQDLESDTQLLSQKLQGLMDQRRSLDNEIHQTALALLR